MRGRRSMLIRTCKYYILLSYVIAAALIFTTLYSLCVYYIMYIIAYHRYLAGGLGSWDVRDQSWNWLVHLDLTTDRARFKALIHSTPTVADLDGDGR